MDSATRQGLAASFGRGASSYAAARPAYPPAAVAWMVGANPCDLLDVGAGAGALTRVAEAAGHRVVAADSSAAMLLQLVGASAPAPAVQCTAEALPFAAARFDVVTVATAFHWFNANEALPEIARVLRRGGRLSLTWNTRDERVAWVRRLGELLRSVQPAGLAGDWATRSVVHLEDSALFKFPEYAEFGFLQKLDRDDLLTLVASRSYVKELDLSRRQRLLADVKYLFDEVAGTAPVADRQHQVRLPYRAQCWRAKRAVPDSSKNG